MLNVEFLLVVGGVGVGVGEEKHYEQVVVW